MPQERLTQQTTWDAPAGPDATREALRAAATAHGGQVVADDPRHVELRFGSRLAARLGGVALPWSRGRLPVRVRVRLEDAPSGGSRVVATAEEDAGWNAASFPNRIAPYRAAMDEAVGHLRRATAPAAG